MLNDARTLYRRFIFGATGLTVAAVLLRILALTLFFDRTVGYIDANVFSTLLYIAMLLLLVGCAGYAACALRLEKKALIAVAPDEGAASPCIRYASLACALAFVGAMVAELFSIGFVGMFPLPRYIAALVAALYFALPKGKGSIVTGLGVPVYGTAALAYEYFDGTVTLNSPIKLMQQAALLSAMLLVLVELCHLNNSRRSIRYTVCAVLSMFCGLTNGLSLLAAALVGGIVKPEYLMHALPATTVALYAAARLFESHEIKLPEPKQEDEEESSPEAADTEQAPNTEQTPDSQDAPPPTSQEEES